MENGLTSDCCGATCTLPEVGVCPDCYEHCEFIVIEDTFEYKITKRVWDDIHNNGTLVYKDFREYFLNSLCKEPKSTSK